MSSNFIWAAPTSLANATTAASLDSLADGSMVLGTVEIDNTTARDTHMDLELVLGSAAFVATGYIAFFILQSLDGSTYPSNTAGASYKLAESNYFAGTIAVHAETASQRQHAYEVRIPPSKFKVAVVNKTTVTLAGSGGNTLQYRTYKMSAS